MEGEDVKRLHAVISGRVQGVSFRYFVVEQAEELSLNGWVRNKWDGSVEVMAEGKTQKLELLLRVLHQGPPMALVADVDFDWLPWTGEFNDFRVVSTL